MHFVGWSLAKLGKEKVRLLELHDAALLCRCSPLGGIRATWAQKENASKRDEATDIERSPLAMCPRVMFCQAF